MGKEGMTLKDYLVDELPIKLGIGAIIGAVIMTSTGNWLNINTIAYIFLLITTPH